MSELPEYATVVPDAGLWADSITSQARRVAGKVVPTGADLARAITGIVPEAHLSTAAQIQITIHDEGFALLDSGFFSPSNVAGKLDPIDVNYPPGSRFWWRLSQVSPAASQLITLTFIDRLAKKMMDRRDKMSFNRATHTRAEALRALVAKAGGHEFYCSQIDRKQTQQPADKPVDNSKRLGLTADMGLTVGGFPMTVEQIRIANIALNRAAVKNASDVATLALIYAAIGESRLGDDPVQTYQPNSSGAVGVWQGTDPHWRSHPPTQVAEQADSFLEGGYGFHFGALALSRTIQNAKEIAVKVEVPDYRQPWPYNPYDQETGGKNFLDEAKAIITHGAGGTQGTGAVEQVQPFFFKTDPTKESDWEAARRWTEEVAWELVVDGDRVYYDSDMTLIRQQPVIVLDRDDPRIADWHYDWEDRNIATQATLTVFVDAFAWRPGEVVMLRRFGAASECSTAKPARPGAWLISDIQPADVGALTRDVQLIQPAPQKKEPAPAVKTVTNIGDTLGALEAAARDVVRWGVTYGLGGGHGARQLDNLGPGGTLDCSGLVCYCLHRAGLFPQDAAVDSTFLASHYGTRGHGQEITVWATLQGGPTGHAFIEINPQGGQHMQINTAGSPWYRPWDNLAQSDVNSGSFIPRIPPGDVTTETNPKGVNTRDWTRMLPSRVTGGKRAMTNVKLIVLHATEGNPTPGDTADLTGVYNTLLGEGYSVHVAINADGRLLRMVPDDVIAFHVGAENDISLGIEQVGYATPVPAHPGDAGWPAGLDAKYDTQAWQWPEQQLRRTARQCAEWSAQHLIEMVKLTTADLEAGRFNGITTHAALSAAGMSSGGHYDPGTDYPIDHIIYLCTTPPPAGFWSP